MYMMIFYYANFFLIFFNFLRFKFENERFVGQKSDYFFCFGIFWSSKIYRNRRAFKIINHEYFY
jgi:hypothetical protein